VLLLDSADKETEAVIETLAQHANLTLVRCLTELNERRAEREYDALFCGSSFHQARWGDAVQVIRIIVGGDLPIIFLSRTAGEKEWMEMFEFGGSDLLTPPYHESQTLATLGQAVESHRSMLRTNRDSSPTIRTLKQSSAFDC
jgi:PleD family two-component response regulator